MGLVCSRFVSCFVGVGLLLFICCCVLCCFFVLFFAVVVVVKIADHVKMSILFIYHLLFFVTNSNYSRLFLFIFQSVSSI